MSKPIKYRWVVRVTGTTVFKGMRLNGSCLIKCPTKSVAGRVAKRAKLEGVWEEVRGRRVTRIAVDDVATVEVLPFSAQRAAHKKAKVKRAN